MVYKIFEILCPNFRLQL